MDTTLDTIKLIDYGATDKVRMYIKKLAIGPRMRFLLKCKPYISSTPKTFKFFKDNFALELISLSTAKEDPIQAERIYRMIKIYK